MPREIVAEFVLQVGRTVRTLWVLAVASRRRSSPRRRCSLSRRGRVAPAPARSTIRPATRAPPRRRRRRAAPRGKPVAVRPRLAGAVLQDAAPAKQAAEKFRAEDWAAPRPASRKRAEVAAARRRERLAATLPAGAGARQPVEVGRRGQAVRGALRQLPEAGALPRLQRRPLPAAARRRRGRDRVGGRVAEGDGPRGRGRAGAHRRAARARPLGRGAGGDRAPTCERFPNGPRRAEVLFKKAEATGEGAAPAAARRRAPARRPTSPRSTAASGPRRRSRPGASAPASGWSRSRPRCPPPEAALVRARTAAELVTRGMVLLRPQPQPGVGGGVRGRAGARPG